MDEYALAAIAEAAAAGTLDLNELRKFVLPSSRDRIVALEKEKAQLEAALAEVSVAEAPSDANGAEA